MIGQRLELGTERLIGEKRDGVGWLVFNNPDRHNALSVEMQSAVPAVVEELAGDSEVRVVVMRGAGDAAFASGADISEFEKERSTAAARDRFERVFAAAGAALDALEKPLVAMIHGYCMGGGLAVALHADLRIAAADASFGIPAARLGVGYRFGGIRRLVDLVGPANASDILLTARRLGAAEALDMGLVNRVVAKAELESTIRELTRTVAENAPLTLRAAKLAIREAVKDRETRDLARVERLVEACFESADYVEGRRAFLEKRRPRFQGR